MFAYLEFRPPGPQSRYRPRWIWWIYGDDSHWPTTRGMAACRCIWAFESVSSVPCLHSGGCVRELPGFCICVFLKRRICAEGATWAPSVRRLRKSAIGGTGSVSSNARWNDGLTSPSAVYSPVSLRSDRPSQRSLEIQNDFA